MSAVSITIKLKGEGTVKVAWTSTEIREYNATPEETTHTYTYTEPGTYKPRITGALDTIMSITGANDIYINVPVVTGFGSASDASFTSITFGPRVRRIEDDAFRELETLTSLVFQTSSLTYIGKHAFKGCVGLTSVTLPDSIKEIGEGAFAACTALTTITLPQNLLEVPVGCFEGCTGLTSVTLPNAVTGILKDAFKGCTSITTLPNLPSVRWIGENAFENTNITIVELPMNVITVGDKAFNTNQPITKLDTGGVRKMGADVFKVSASCEITIGASLTDAVQPYLIYNAAPTTSTIVFNATLERFEGLDRIIKNPAQGYKLRSLKIGGVSVIGNDERTSVLAGVEVENLFITPAVKKIAPFAFHSAGLKNVVINEGLQEIGENAFEGNTGLNLYLGATLPENECVFPSTIKYIRTSAFEGSFTDVSVINLGSTKLDTLDGYVFKCINAGDQLSVTLPITLTSIGIGSFYDAGVTSLDIANCKRLTYIGKQAFYNHNVEELDFNGCSNLTSIGEEAFYTENRDVNAPKLSALTKLTTIGKGAFCIRDGQTGEETDTLSLPASITVINKDAFFGLNRVKVLNFSNMTLLTLVDTGSFETTTTVPTTITYPTGKESVFASDWKKNRTPAPAE